MKVTYPEKFLVTTQIQAYSGNESKMVATGFFYERNQQLALVTNRHVVIDEKENYRADLLTVKLHTDENYHDLRKNHDYEIQLCNDAGETLWLEHPDPELDVDVVCIPIRQDDPLRNAAVMALAPENHFPDDMETALVDEVKLYGYPGGYYDDVHNLPIVKTGHVASAFGIPHKNKPYFLVDTTIAKGMSGSPVFSHGSMRYFLGILSADLSILLEVTKNGKVEEEKLDLNLSIIWYARLIGEILDQLPENSPQQ